jgi:hypothetical protein
MTEPQGSEGQRILVHDFAGAIVQCGDGITKYSRCNMPKHFEVVPASLLAVAEKRAIRAEGANDNLRSVIEYWNEKGEKLTEALRVAEERADDLRTEHERLAKLLHAEQIAANELLADSERKREEAVALLREARKQMDLEENWQAVDFRPKADAFLAAEPKP